MKHGKYPLIITFLVPPLLLYGYFVLSPYAQAFQVATTNWGGLSADYKYVGLANFRRLLHDGHVWNAIRHNAILLVLLPVLTILLGLFFATMLNMGGRRGRAGIVGVRGSAVYRVVYFAPQVLSVSVIGVLWNNIYDPRGGLLNGLLHAAGLDGLAQSWLGDPRFAFWALLAVLVWSNVGFYVVLFGAAMQAVPRDLYEAALLDGADRAAMLRRITLPLLWDTVQVAWIYLAVVALDAFALVQIMTRGGPDFSTDVIGQRMYDTAFVDSQFGYASAMGVAIFFMTLAVAVLALRVTRRDRVEL
jgi:N-acetylglucosamine transport system permease protein